MNFLTLRSLGCGLTAAALFTGLCAQPSVVNAYFPIPSPTPASATTPTPKPHPLGGTICAAADPAQLLHWPKDERRPLLEQRLINCAAQLNELTSAHPDMTQQSAYPSGKCAYSKKTSISVLADELKRCVSFIAGAPPAPKPSPPSFYAGRNTFYVFAVQSDAGSTPLVVERVVQRLQYSMQAKNANADNLAIVGRTDWTTFSAFQAQCNADNDRTVGALVIDGLVPLSGTENLLAWTYGWTRLNASAELLTCPKSDDDGLAVPKIAWNRTGFEGGGYRNGFPFVTVGAYASILNKNSNQTQTQVTTTTVTPAPSPNPAATTSVTTTTTTANNNITPSILFGSVASALQGQTAPGINASSQLNAASYNMADNIMSHLNDACQSPSSPAGTMKDLCDLFGGFTKTPAPPARRVFFWNP